MNSIVHSLAAPFESFWQAPRVLIFHLIGNGLLFSVVYFWLVLPDQRIWHLAVSALLAAGIASAALSLHGGTVRFFAGDAVEGFVAAVRAAARKVAPLLAWTIVAALAVWAAAAVEGRLFGAGAATASWLTRTLEKPVHPETATNWFGWGWWIVSWAVLLLVLLPCAAGAAQSGWASFQPKRAGAAIGGAWCGRYLAAAVLFVLLGWYLPWLLVFRWIPDVDGLVPQAASFGVRALIGYLLVTAAWVGLLQQLGKLQMGSK